MMLVTMRILPIEDLAGTHDKHVLTRASILVVAVTYPTHRVWLPWHVHPPLILSASSKGTDLTARELQTPGHLTYLVNELLKVLPWRLALVRRGEHVA
jgi:hypothetical protein